MAYEIVKKANVKDVAGYHVYKSLEATAHATAALNGATFSVPVNQSSVNIAVVVDGSGTSPLCDVDLEVSWDGTNWSKLADIGSQVAGDGNTYENHVFSTTGSGPYYRLSYVLDRTTADETYTINAYYWYKAQGTK